jgi:hypothetical protein
LPGAPAADGFWRRPGAVGLILAFVSVALMPLAGQGSFVVVLLTLCLYPVVDLPRIHRRSSWWLGAAASTVVWLALFVWVTVAAELINPLGEMSMLLMLPAMMFPAALVVSGLVRLEGWIRGRARASEPRIAAMLVTGACALFVVVPVTLNTLPALVEAVTGDSPANWVYSSEGEVVTTTADVVTIRTGDAEPETFHLEPGVTFDFRGPGSAIVAGTAGREWLEPGQRIALTYVRRNREAWASHVDIWIERKGCAGDSRWTSMPPAAPADATSLAGTVWESETGPADPARTETALLEFLPDQQFAYQDIGRDRLTNGAWRQSGASVIAGVNDCYALYEGRIEGDAIAGQFTNEVGVNLPWRARRRAGVP